MSGWTGSRVAAALWLAVKNILFTLVAPGSVAVWVPRWIAGGASTAPTWLRLLSVVPFSAGAGIYAWCVWDFATLGRGTPAPIDAPKQLVVRGLYRYLRNPMYLGVLLVVAGQALWFGAPALVVYGAGFALGFHAFVRLVEEPSLGRQFTPAYQAYCATVPRWIPRRPRR